MNSKNFWKYIYVIGSLGYPGLETVAGVGRSNQYSHILLEIYIYEA